MNNSTDELKNLILDRFGTVVNFSKAIGLPNSTVASILTRGLTHTTVDNMRIICDALGLDVRSYSEGKLCPAVPDHNTGDLEDITKIYLRSVSTSTLNGSQITSNEAEIIKMHLDLAIKIIRQQNRQ